MRLNPFDLPVYECSAIENRQIHHHKKSFPEVYKHMLFKSGIESGKNVFLKKLFNVSNKRNFATDIASLRDALVIAINCSTDIVSLRDALVIAINCSTDMASLRDASRGGFYQQSGSYRMG
jgi:hypothetical protein